MREYPPAKTSKGRPFFLYYAPMAVHAKLEPPPTISVRRFVPIHCAAPATDLVPESSIFKASELLSTPTQNYRLGQQPRKRREHDWRFGDFGLARGTGRLLDSDQFRPARPTAITTFGFQDRWRWRGGRSVCSPVPPRPRGTGEH